MCTYIGMQKIWIFAIWSIFLPSAELCWNRSALIYHIDGRDGESWKLNFMRVNENGKFVGQWLFDHAILTTVSIHDKDIMYGGLDGSDLLALLDALTLDVEHMDKAIGELMSTFPRKGQIPVSLAMPYIDNHDRIVSVEGQNYHLSIPQDRRKLVYWYIRKINQLKQNAGLTNVVILGVYYHREDVIDVYGDVEIITYFNEQVHATGMKSVWVPYYNAPHAWDGKTLLGFDILVVQPGYSFASSIDRGSATGDRLYAMGRKSAVYSQCFEYELRGGGQDKLENWIAHQYLAIAQSTGAWKFPQVFFTGSDFFDRMGAGAKQEGDRWFAYSDLVNYLAGKSISNLEVSIPFGMNDYESSTNIVAKIWTVPDGYDGLTSIRLDFSDSYGGYWKGKLVVKVAGAGGGGVTSSFSQRTGEDIVDPVYNAILVPLANVNITVGMQLVIELHKEAASPWPNLIQMVGAKYEPPFIANPLFEAFSSASVSVKEGPYADNAPTWKQYARGKLTDSKVSSGSWAWDGVMGWSLIPEGVFSVTIDLEGAVGSISEVRVWTHIDQYAGVRLPTKLSAIVATSCPPQMRGTLELGCPLTASSGPVKIKNLEPNNNINGRVLLTLPFENVNARWVTVTGVPLAWFLLDEIEILNTAGTVLSKGKPYRVIPIPGEGKAAFPYTDRGRTLVDGSIFKSFVAGSTDVIGISKEQKEGQVETIWDVPKSVRCARVWLTEANWNYGIGLPADVDLQIRDANKNWQSSVKVAISPSCGPAPCARLCFASKRLITGVKASFYNLQSWVMITEISVE